MEGYEANSKKNGNELHSLESPSPNSHLVAPPRYNVKAFHITGGIQIVCAVASVLSGIVSVLLAKCVFQEEESCNYNGQSTFFGLDMDNAVTTIMWPILAGLIIYLATGIVGGCTINNKRSIIDYLLMSVLTTLCSAGQAVWESILTGSLAYSFCQQYDCNYGISATAVGAHGVCAGAAVINTMISIIAIALCCHQLCCASGGCSRGCCAGCCCVSNQLQEDQAHMILQPDDQK